MAEIKWPIVAAVWSAISISTCIRCAEATLVVEGGTLERYAQVAVRTASPPGTVLSSDTFAPPSWPANEGLAGSWTAIAGDAPSSGFAATSIQVNSSAQPSSVQSSGRIDMVVATQSANFESVGNALVFSSYNLRIDTNAVYSLSGLVEATRTSPTTTSAVVTLIGPSGVLHEAIAIGSGSISTPFMFSGELAAGSYTLVCSAQIDAARVSGQGFSQQPSAGFTVALSIPAPHSSLALMGSGLAMLRRRTRIAIR